jgi:hypothetical protein
MRASKSIPKPKSPLSWRVIGSALSSFVGWLTMNLIVLVWAFFNRAVDQSVPAQPNKWLLDCFALAICSAGFVFAAWLLALLPLYLLVPARSFLWRWSVCTPCGALAGGLIMRAFFGPGSVGIYSFPFIPLAALTGATTCLFGSLTARRFHGLSDSAHSQSPFFRS